MQSLEYSSAAMTGLEEMTDAKPVNHTPAIALGVAALLLLVVAGMSYKDYVRNKYEKEFAEKEKTRMAGYGQPQQLITNQQQQAPQFPQRPRGNQFPSAPTAAQQQVPTTPAAQQADPSRLPTQTNLPQPRDPELAQLEMNLAKAEARAKENEKRYNELLDKQTPSPPPTPAGTKGSAAPLSPALQSALENPPGGNPEIMEQITRMKKLVLSSPSIGRVLSYDNDWGIITFDAGAAQGILAKQRYAVRRGSDILGWVKVAEVHAEMSIAHLVTKNADSEVAMKPQAGDSLIKFEL